MRRARGRLAYACEPFVKKNLATANEARMGSAEQRIAQEPVRGAFAFDVEREADTRKTDDEPLEPAAPRCRDPLHDIGEEHSKKDEAEYGD